MDPEDAPSLVGESALLHQAVRKTAAQTPAYTSAGLRARRQAATRKIPTTTATLIDRVKTAAADSAVANAHHLLIQTRDSSLRSARSTAAAEARARAMKGKSLSADRVTSIRPG